jgi:hypothetical protein
MDVLGWKVGIAADAANDGIRNEVQEEIEAEVRVTFSPPHEKKSSR